MDRDELKKQQAPFFANTAEVSESDRPALLGIAGREDNLEADPASVSALDIDQPVGAVARSTITGRHEPGMGANETADGLSSTEEAIRSAAEDEDEVDKLHDAPIFDRAESIPKITD